MRDVLLETSWDVVTDSVFYETRTEIGRRMSKGMFRYKRFPTAVDIDKYRAVFEIDSKR